MTVDPGQMIWDERLITRTRALELAGHWPLYLDAGPVVLLRCGRCHQSCGAFDSLIAQTTVEEILSGVLRHLVMAHDVALSGVDNG